MSSESTQFLHYQIERQLGKGGMGEVFLARDTRLKRRVALKFLSEGVSADLSAMERFEREAQAAAALNHPSIVTIYEIGEHAGRHYIAMEYVEGLSLREMIATGPLPVEQALNIAWVLTVGLEKAHERGIIHRDIKPENIVVTDDGDAKLLDFGIAKLKGTRNLTLESRTVGTVRYMAPEQIKGETVDQRADVWALGVVIYEMLTANSPFKGDYDSTLMFSILSEEPEPIATFRQDVPQELEAVVRTALAKEPKDRYAGMGALRSAIDLLHSPTVPSTGPRAQRADRRLWWAGGGVAVTLACWLLWLLLGSGETPPPSVAVLQQVTYLGDISGFDIAPDGTTAAYISGGRPDSQSLHILDLTGGSSIEIFSARRMGSPFWSPDARSLAVTAVLDDSTSGTFLVPRLGGSPRRLSPAISLRLCWSTTGDRLALYDAATIKLVETTTGESKALALPDSAPILGSLEYSPDGLRLLGSSISDQASTLWLIDLASGAITAFAREGFDGGTVLISPRWSPSGKEIWCLRRTVQSGEAELLAYGYDRRTRASERPRVVATGLQDAKEFDISSDGHRILAMREVTHANFWLALRNGPTMMAHRLTRGTAWRSRASLSPEGDRVAFSMKDVEGFNVYVMPLSMGGSTPSVGQPAKITSLRAFTFAPVWSPDGKTIAFGSAGAGSLQIWKVTPDGSNLERFERTRLQPGADPLQWAPGSEIIYTSHEGKRLRRLDPLSGFSEPLVRSDSVSRMDAPVWSPNGEEFALRVYRGREDTMTGVWIASRQRLERRLTSGWEYVPVGWAPDGRTIFLMKGGRPVIYAIGIRGGTPEVAFTLPFESAKWTDLSVQGNADRVLTTRFRSQTDLWLVGGIDGDAGL